MSGTYKDLEVWQAAMDLAVRIYRLTLAFPKEERYGLTSQMRRPQFPFPATLPRARAGLQTRS